MSSSLEDGQESLVVSRARITATLAVIEAATTGVWPLYAPPLPPRSTIRGPNETKRTCFRSSSTHPPFPIFDRLRSIARWSVEFRDGNSDEFLTVQRPAVGENEEAEYRWHARGQRSRFCILAGMRTCSCIRSESGATADHPPRCTVHGSRHFFPVLLFRPFHPPSSHFFSPHAPFLHYNRKSNFYTLTFLSLALRTRSTPRLAPRDFIFRS